MAENNIYVDKNHNQQSIKDAQFKEVAAPTFEGHETRTISTRQILLGGVVKTYAFLSDLAQDPVQLAGSLDASGGNLPAGAGIVPGYKYVVTVGGTIAGIQGDDTLSNGDMLLFIGGSPDDAADATQWVGVQQNQNDAKVGAGDFQRITVALAANTPLTAIATTLTDVHSINIYNSAGEEIELKVSKTANLNERVLESNIALVGVVVEFGGIL